MSEHKTFKWLDKLKQIKHIELYISLIFIIVLLLIYLSSTSSKKTLSNNSKTSSEQTITTYVENLENNLAEILSNIEGVTNVKVLITLDMQQVSVTNSQLNYEAFPDIKGIVVTANGVGNTANKMKVLHAIEAVLDVTNGSIQILSSD